RRGREPVLQHRASVGRRHHRSRGDAYLSWIGAVDRLQRANRCATFWCLSDVRSRSVAVSASRSNTLRDGATSRPRNHMQVNWFLFDLGNTVIKLAYERAMENICKLASIKRDELVDLLEQAGGYRDLERGAISFIDFYDFLRERAEYRGSLGDLQGTWADFFDGPVPGIEEVLERVRQKYRVAFLSNSNEIHAEVIPR